MIHVVTLDHVGILVSDLERSVEFYHVELGLEFVATEELFDGPAAEMTAMSGVHIREYRLRPAGGVNGHARLEGQGFTFDLLQWLSPEGPTHRGPINQVPTVHIAFGVEDVTAMHARLVEAGIEVVSPPVRFAGYGEWLVFFCYDPDGNLLEFNEIGAGVQPEHDKAEHPWSRFYS